MFAKPDINSSTIYAGPMGLVGMTKLVLKEEGISGFYGGVTGVMIGQGNLCHAFMSGPTHNFFSNFVCHQFSRFRKGCRIFFE